MHAQGLSSVTQKKGGKKSNLIIVEKLSTYHLIQVIKVKTVININNMNPLTRYTEKSIISVVLPPKGAVAFQP